MSGMAENANIANARLGLEEEVEEEEEEEEEEEDGEEAVDSFAPPLSGEMVLGHGKKPVSAVDLDVAGARLVSGAEGDEGRWDRERWRQYYAISIIHIGTILGRDRFRERRANEMHSESAGGGRGGGNALCMLFRRVQGFPCNDNIYIWGGGRAAERIKCFSVFCIPALSCFFFFFFFCIYDPWGRGLRFRDEVLGLFWYGSLPSLLPHNCSQ